MNDPIALGLPHREPFIFVDEIVSLQPGHHAVGRVTFCGDRPFFRGHFPGRPIVPGVILTEALAQVGGIVAGSASGERFLLSAIREMKFPRAAGPDETISLEATLRGELGGLYQFDAEASSPAGLVARGRLVLSRAEP